MPHFMPHFMAIFLDWSLVSLVLVDETSVAVAAKVVVARAVAAGNDNAAVRAAMDSLDTFNFIDFPLKKCALHKGA